MPFVPPTPSLPPESTSAKPTSVLVVPHYEVQWNRPVFKAPALVDPDQSAIAKQFPFSAQFRAKPRATK